MNEFHFFKSRSRIVFKLARACASPNPIRKMTFPILITDAQIDAFVKCAEMTNRPVLSPVLEEVVTTFMNNDCERKIPQPDGTVVKEMVTSELILKPGQKLFGVPDNNGDYGVVKLTNMGPAAELDVLQPDNTRAKQIVATGETVVAFFEASFTLCYFPEVTEGVVISPAKVTAAFDRNGGVSNFCYSGGAVDVPIKGTDKCLKGPCVEALFQLTKAVLTGNTATVEAAAAQPSAGKLKGFMGNRALGVPGKWFKGPDGGNGMCIPVMEYLQAHAATDPSRYSVLEKILKAAMSMGVEKENVSIVEHNKDTLYGDGLLPGDLRSIFEEKPVPGQNQMGRIVTDIARKIVELETHEAYVAWFHANYPPIFEMEEVVLGIRTADDAELPESGRSGSVGRTE